GGAESPGRWRGQAEMTTRRKVPGWLLLPLAAALAAVPRAHPAPEAASTFRDITREAGIVFKHHAAPEKKFIVESMSGGVALLDFDNDGLVDIFLTDSLTVDTANDPKAARSALYRNLGQGRFEDVTQRAGLEHPGWAMVGCP